MKIILTLLFFCTSAAFAFARLPKIPFENIAGEFSQIKTYRDLDISVKSSGDFVVRKKRELLWQTRKPTELGFLLTPEGAFQIRKGKKTPLPESARPMLQTLYVIFDAAFAGDKATLEKVFKITREADSEAWTLIPREEPLASFLKKIELRASEDKINEVRLEDASGDKTQILFSGIRDAEKTKKNSPKNARFHLKIGR